MGLKWFVQKDDSVDGPLSTEDVQTRLQTGQLSPNHMIWGRGLANWQKLQWWSQELPKLATQGHAVEPVSETWHYALAGKSHGPFNKATLVNELKNQHNLGDVMVWTKGMKEWAPLFEFHDLLTAVGVNKRQFPRADLDGRAIIKTSEHTLVARLLTISEGGCGIHLDGGLVPGQAFTIELQSSAFREVIHAKAECRYIDEGYCGIKFTNLSQEPKSLIIQFVKSNQTRFVLKAA